MKQKFPQEEVVVVVTRDGYIAFIYKVILRSEENEVGIKEDDYIIGYFQMNTIDKILLLLNLEIIYIFLFLKSLKQNGKT